MNKRLLLMGIFIFSLLIPGLYILTLESAFSDGSTQDEVVRAITGYRLRVWLSWVIMVFVAIYNKWTTRSNIFFKIIYLLLVFTFAIEGIYLQRMVNMFDVPTNFKDTFSFGIFTTLLNIVMATGLTAFLHAGVWWFTRKWHRE